MPTKRREQSESGFYHVFQRGVNHFDIFEDDEDREYYIEQLKKAAAKTNVEVHAWCLMSNHTHLLLRAGYEQLSAMMRQLGSMFARHFNQRHGRSGPLFSGRFCSVCVTTDAQLLSVIRYIHRNPAHHDERTLCGEYPWSSYREYLAGVEAVATIGFAMSLFGSTEKLIAFHEEERDHERHIDIDSIGPMNDGEARNRANRALAKAGYNVSIAGIGALSRDLRDRAITLVKGIVGCSLRQIQRLSAIAYAAIRAAVINADYDCDYSYQNDSQPLVDLLGAVKEGESHAVESLTSDIEAENVNPYVKSTDAPLPSFRAPMLLPAPQ